MGTPAQNGFAITRISDIEPRAEGERWLIEGLWAGEACGLIGATPKTGKTWLGLSMAIAVASGKPLLGKYEVKAHGPALVFPAEGSRGAIRERVDMLAAAQGIDLTSLPLHLLDTDTLHLDDREHRARLEATLNALKPKLIVLDPLVRLHTGHESDTQHVAEVLGYLRSLQARHGVAIAVTHHLSKGRAGSASAEPGDMLRGSGDLHAWGDSNLYLIKCDGGVVRCHVEQRDSEAPAEPIHFRLEVTAPRDDAASLASLVPCAAPVVDASNAPASRAKRSGGGGARGDAPKRRNARPLRERVLEALRASGQPRSQKSLRVELGCNNQRLTDALRSLESDSQLVRGTNGWILQ